MLWRTILLVSTIATLTAPAAADPKKLWTVEGLAAPESALPDPAAGVIYVSNIGGKPLDKDGDGFISKVGLDGKVITLKWVTGFDAPKGLALADGILYVSDIDKLAEISVEDGKIRAIHQAPGAKFLNDVTVDEDGNVYVADTGTSIIWRLAEGKFEPWLESADLDFPNGLLVEGDRIVVASWGVMPDETGKGGRLSSLREVKIADKTITPLGDKTPVGNLDGLEPESETTFLVTDWVNGGLFRIDVSGKATKLIPFKQGSADIGYDPASKIVYVPLMLENTLEAYQLD